jgi:hypothetical protein
VSRVVCIVGMHRSGTSCLAGSLQEAGLHLGDVITSAPYNAKGNRENKRIMDLHEAVLAHSGGSWDRPPERVLWSQAHRDERDQIIGSYRGVETWGFKDPRSLLLLDFWREALPDITFIGTFRSPRLVAESLLRRNGGSLDQWFELWAYYNRRLLALNEARPFPIISFDLGEDAYRRSLSVVVERLGLTAPPEAGFFDPALRHQDESPDPLPESVAATYDALIRTALVS